MPPRRSRTATTYYEVWVVGRSLNPNSVAGIECPLVGAFDSNNAFNEFGINGDALRYYDFVGVGRPSAEAGNGLTDDRCRLVGAEHQDASLKLFVGTAQQSATSTAVSFSTTYTGWQTLGCDADAGTGLPQHAAKFVFGAVIVLKTNVASSSAFRTKLDQWANKWRGVS